MVLWTLEFGLDFSLKVNVGILQNYPTIETPFPICRVFKVFRCQLFKWENTRKTWVLTSVLRWAAFETSSSTAAIRSSGSTPTRWPSLSSLVKVDVDEKQKGFRIGKTRTNLFANSSRAALASSRDVPNFSQSRQRNPPFPEKKVFSQCCHRTKFVRTCQHFLFWYTHLQRNQKWLSQN